jgi:hypothetical protein
MKRLLLVVRTSGLAGFRRRTCYAGTISAWSMTRSGDRAGGTSKLAPWKNEPSIA